MYTNFQVKTSFEFPIWERTVVATRTPHTGSLLYDSLRQIHTDCPRALRVVAVYLQQTD
jgi:hypothetical protein